MSGTEKTNPFHVKLWNGTLARVASHDHRFGPCDLPVTLEEHLDRGAGGWWRNDGHCRWQLHYTGVGVCCCSLCRCQSSVRREKKGQRRRANVALGELVKSFRAGDVGDFD